MKIKAMGSIAALGTVVVLGMGLSVPAAGGPPAEGVSLFNGKDLDGWHKPMGVHEDYRGGKWEVVDGVLLGDQDPPGKGGFLVTDGIYRDYVIEFDVMLDDPADSGVFLRMGEDGKNHQVTLDNDKSKKFGWIYLSWGKGTVHESPKGLEHFRQGEWNSVKIRIEGEPSRIQVWLERGPHHRLPAHRGDDRGRAEEGTDRAADPRRGGLERGQPGPLPEHPTDRAVARDPARGRPSGARRPRAGRGSCESGARPPRPRPRPSPCPER